MNLIGEIHVPETFPLRLTVEEGNQLLGIMDLAVKSGGLQVAAVALPRAGKLQAAAQAANEAPEGPPKESE